MDRKPVARAACSGRRVHSERDPLIRPEALGVSLRPSVGQREEFRGHPGQARRARSRSSSASSRTPSSASSRNPRVNQRRWPASVRPAGTGSNRPSNEVADDRQMPHVRDADEQPRARRGDAAAERERRDRILDVLEDVGKDERVEPFASRSSPARTRARSPSRTRSHRDRASDASRGSFSIPVTSQAGFRAFAAAMPAPGPAAHVEDPPGARTECRRVSSGRSLSEGSLRTTDAGSPDPLACGASKRAVTF